MVALELAESEAVKSHALLVVVFNFSKLGVAAQLLWSSSVAGRERLRIPNGNGRGDVLAPNRGIPDTPRRAPVGVNLETSPSSGCPHRNLQTTPDGASSTAGQWSIPSHKSASGH